MKKLISVILLSLCFQCSQEPFELRKKEFSIVFPNNWKEIKIKGIDSKVYGVQTNKKDTIIFDYGLYSKKFKKTIKVFSRQQIKKYDSLEMDTEYLKWSDTPEIDENQAIFHSSYYYYDTINGEIGKVKVPKIGHKGVTGISFRNVNGSKNHLTIYAKNIDLKTQQQLLNSFKTIKFSSH